MAVKNIHVFNELLYKELIFNNCDEFNQNILTSKEDIFILHLNIRSISRNHILLAALIANFTKEPEIIICTESWITHIKGLIDLDGYSMQTNESSINKCDGVLIYIKKNIQHITQIKSYGKLQAINVTLQLNNGKNTITGIYRCHDYQEHEFIEDLKLFLKDNTHTENHLIIGDVNIDIIQENTNSSDYMDNLLEMSYLPYISSATRPNNDNGGSCIDHIFIKSKNNKFSYTTGKLLYTITDHIPIFAIIKNNKIIKGENNNYSLNYKKLLNLSTKVDWNKVLTIQDPSEALSMLTDKIKKLMNESVKKVNKKNKSRNPWMTNGLIISCNTKNNLYKLWQKNKNDKIIELKYKQYANKLRHLLRLAKDNFDTKIIKNANIQTFWQFIKSKLNKGNSNKNKNQNIDYIISNGKKHENKFDIANKFNDYFSSVGINLTNDLEKPKNSAEIKNI